MNLHVNYGLQFESHPIYGAYLKEIKLLNQDSFRLMIFLSHLKDERNEIVDTYIPLIDSSILNSSVNTIELYSTITEINQSTTSFKFIDSETFEFTMPTSDFRIVLMEWYEFLEPPIQLNDDPVIS